MLLTAKKLIVVVSLALSLLSLEAASGQVVVGPYLWGGFLAGSEENKIARSLNFLLNEGFKAVRIAVTPNSDNSTANCPEPKMLVCLIAHALSSVAFDDQRLRILMITLHDFTTDRGGGFRLDSIKLHRKEIFEEYYAAFSTIARRFKHRKLSVIVSNWEGDNLIFCGSVYDFARDAAFARLCKERINDRFEERLDSIFEWFSIREEALNAVKRDGEVSEIDIEQAMEFNNLHVFPMECTHACNNNLKIFESLRSRAYRVPCSYSSYDSINRDTLAQDLVVLSTTCKYIIIGEAGFRSRDNDLDSLHERWLGVARAVMAQESIVRAIFIWNAFDGPKAAFGLYGPNGEPRIVKTLPPPFAPN